MQLFLRTAFTRIFGDMTLTQAHDLVFPGEQPPLVKRRRAVLIVSRVRMVAAVFALLTPIWIPVDLLIFESPLGIYLGTLRFLAAIAFAGLALSFRNNETMSGAYKALAWLLAIPTGFYLMSHPLLGQFEITDPAQQLIATGYAFLPFVMIGGLSVFPITALEGAAASIPLWTANFVVALLGYPALPFAFHLGALWLLALLAVVATLAGMSQLHFMMQLVSQASHDGLTRAYTRRVGEEMLDIHFALAKRNAGPMALAFVDLDNFKSVNDRYGHEEGDDTLRAAAVSLRRILRRGDILIRWGGEEFLVVMPNTDAAGARTAIVRLREIGLGVRPDGVLQTASIGIAERVADDCASWTELVERADQRMYAAKQSGKDRVVTCGDEAFA